MFDKITMEPGHSLDMYTQHSLHVWVCEDRQYMYQVSVRIQELDAIKSPWIRFYRNLSFSVIAITPVKFPSKIMMKNNFKYYKRYSFSCEKNIMIEILYFLFNCGCGLPNVASFSYEDPIVTLGCTFMSWAQGSRYAFSVLSRCIPLFWVIFTI